MNRPRRLKGTIGDHRLRFLFPGHVRDYDRLERAMEDIDIVAILPQ